MSSRSIEISQKDNYEGNFGIVYRSSAIFYYLQKNDFKTTISLMDYWKPKRGVEVMITFSLRDMQGKLIDRRRINFEKSNVINYTYLSDTNFEGSVEVEVFCGTNMVIPYSAIMAVYEHKNSISMCHSYGRIYCPHEIEEKRMITIGEESCWTVLDTKDIHSFAIFHNGHGIQEKQKIKLEALNHKNEKIQAEYELDALTPYSTIKIVPQNIFGNKLVDFLEGKPGNMSISFDLNSSFTRMLIGNESASEFQVTHSNFNYSKHKSDNAGEGDAYMYVPNAGFKDYEIVVYPDCSLGNYKIEKDGKVVSEFKSGNRVTLPIESGFIKISKDNGLLPSRIVTGLTAKPAKENARLPYECSLGIVHKLRPMKSTFWGLVAVEDGLESRIFIIPIESIYGKNNDNELTIQLYTEQSHEPIETTLTGEQLAKASAGLYVSQLFPELKNMKTGRFAWFYFRTQQYGGFQTYSTLENKVGSLTMEHSF